MEGHNTYGRECVAVGHEWKMAFEEKNPLRGPLFGDPLRWTIAALLKLPGSGFLLCVLVRESALGSSTVPVIVCLCVCAWT